MNEFTPLVDKGENVKVLLSKVKDRIPKSLYKSLLEDSFGQVSDYKMTDGGMIGYILKLRDGSTIWFFDYEIYEHGKDAGSNSSRLYSTNLHSNVETSVSDLIIGEWIPRKGLTLIELFNPLNFLKWIVFSLKDNF